MALIVRRGLSMAYERRPHTADKTTLRTSLQKIEKSYWHKGAAHRGQDSGIPTDEAWRRCGLYSRCADLVIWSSQAHRDG